MSLNWKEINEILSEIPFEGSLIRNIYQPSHHELVLELYNRGKNFRILISLETGVTRIHTISKKPRNPQKPPRFVLFLRAHVKNGRISTVYQVDSERIVKLVVRRYNETTILWIRLWGGAANIIATDEEGNILDAHYRRPKRGEISGGYYNPEKQPLPEVEGKSDRYNVRELPGEGSFNERVESYYRELKEKSEREKLVSSIIQLINTRENRLLSTLEELESKKKDYENFERYKELGDLIMATLHRIKKGESWIETEDFFNENRPVTIQLDEKLNPSENAEKYYKKYRKFKAGLKRLENEISNIRGNLNELGKKRAIVTKNNTDISTLREIRREFERKSVRKQETTERGLSFVSKGFTIRVGRNAKENDELLRRYAHGNDFWFHARDYPGSYVFVRSKPGKSLPLDTMLDASNLALYYSKRKNSGEGDVYYTRVKYLRRMKDGKTGLVIPTKEKNLHITLDMERIKRLKSFF